MTTARPIHVAPAASPVATAIARGVLRCARLTPFQVLAWFHRDWADRSGGRCFTAKSADGALVHCVYLPAYIPLPLGEGKARFHRDAGEGLNSVRRRLPVLSLHGWWQVQEQQTAHAHMLRAQGHDVLIPGLRCHGRSGGRCVTFGAREKQDLIEVLNKAQELQLIGDKVLTMGLSLGAASALQHAAIDPRVAGVVALAPFLDMATAVESYRRRYGSWFNSQWVARGFEAASRREGFEMAEASTLDAMRRITAPVLLAVGQEDRNLSPAVHTRVLAAAKTRGLCRLIEVPQAHHFNIHRGPWPGLNEAIVEFLAQAGE